MLLIPKWNSNFKFCDSIFFFNTYIIIAMDPYSPRTRTTGRKKNIGLSQKEYTKVRLILLRKSNNLYQLMWTRSQEPSRLFVGTDTGLITWVWTRTRLDIIHAKGIRKVRVLGICASLIMLFTFFQVRTTPRLSQRLLLFEPL